MRSSVLFFVFASLLAFSQGSAVKPHAVQWSCDVSEIMDLAEDVVTDFRNLVSDVAGDVGNAISDAEDCARAFLSDLDVSALFACMKNDVHGTITNISDSVESFLHDAKSEAKQIAQKVEKCFSL